MDCEGSGKLQVRIQVRGAEHLQMDEGLPDCLLGRQRKEPYPVLFHTRQDSLLVFFHPSTSPLVWRTPARTPALSTASACPPPPVLPHLAGRAPWGPRSPAGLPCRQDLSLVRAPGSCHTMPLEVQELSQYTAQVLPCSSWTG